MPPIYKERGFFFFFGACQEKKRKNLFVCFLLVNLQSVFVKTEANVELRHYRNKITKMANHKSALKRIRSNEAKRLRNRYQLKTTRTFIKRLRALESQEEAFAMQPQVFSLIDKLAKNRIIHKNKAANIKSGLAVRANKMA